MELSQSQSRDCYLLAVFECTSFLQFKNKRDFSAASRGGDFLLKSRGSRVVFTVSTRRLVLAFKECSFEILCSAERVK